MILSDYQRLRESPKICRLEKISYFANAAETRCTKRFLNFLGPEDDITRFEYLKKSARNFGSILIGIETKSPDSFNDFFRRLKDAGFTYSDITNDETLSQFV